MEHSSSGEAGKKNLFQLAWPIFADMSLRVLTGTVNIFMVSQLSALYVASMTPGNQLFSLSIVIFNFIGIGTCVVIAQMLGSGEFRNIKKIIHCAFGFNIVLGTAVLLAVLIFSGQILDLMQIDREIRDGAGTYMIILAFSLVPEACGICAASVLRAYGRTKEAMYSSLTANIITVISNLLLLFGFFGLPMLGLAGAAISVVLGRLASLLMILYFYRKRVGIKLRLGFMFRVNTGFIRRILRIGLPAAGENLAWNSQFMVATAFIASMGNYELATHTYYFQTICMFMMLFAVSIGSATEIMVAFHIGAGNYELVYRRLIRSLKIGLADSLIIATIMACGFSGMLLDLFSNHSPQVAELAAPLILLSVMMEPGRAFNVIVINSLRAANDASFPMIMAILSMWCVAVPLEYFLGISMQMGLLGVWIAFTCDEWIRGISMYFRWKTRIWQRKSMNVSRETMLRQV